MKLRLSIHGIWPLMNLISLSYYELGDWLRITTTIEVYRHHHSESNVIALTLINGLASIGVLQWTQPSTCNVQSCVCFHVCNTTSLSQTRSLQTSLCNSYNPLETNILTTLLSTHILLGNHSTSTQGFILGDPY